MYVPKAGIWLLPTSLFIREHLKSVHRANGYDMWQRLKEERALIGEMTGSWQNFRNYMFWLKKLGLIRQVQTAPSQFRGDSPRILYEVVPEKLKSPAWDNPRKSLYPESYRFFPKRP